MNKSVIITGGITIIIISVVMLLFAPKKQITTEEQVKTPPPREVYIGAWTGGFWDSQTKTLDVSTQLMFEDYMGKKMAFANIYSGWAYLADPDLLIKLNEIYSNRWTPIISSNPSFFEECKNNGKSLYETIGSGSCDGYFRKVAANLKSYNKPIFLRFAWEMNHPNMYWSVDKVKSKPEDFINAWRRFHTVMKEENANNVIWVLSFNTSNSNTIPYAKLYPGDEYVDWVAIDGYNWGTAKDWSGWTSFSGVFKKSYDELTKITDKPLMLSEVNTASEGGNKAEWLKDMLDVQIPNFYPQIDAIVFFNENKMTGEDVDWRMESSIENIEVLKTSLSNKLYKASYP